MTPTNGDDPDGATGAREAGRVVEMEGVNTRSTATNPAKLQELILALAELLPAVFVADRWELYRPLKRGIHRDLIDRGVLLPDECRAVLRRYCSRLMYQRAVAACGPRFDLDRHAAGDVAPDEADHAKAAVAKIEAQQEHKAKGANGIAANERA